MKSIWRRLGSPPKGTARTLAALFGFVFAVPACDSFIEAPSARTEEHREPDAASLSLPVPRVGLKLALVPNLPGIVEDDIPQSSERRVEIIDVRGTSVTLRWSGTTRVETAASITRREKWLKQRFDRPRQNPAQKEPQAEYEEQEVTGTLTFPDFGRATAYLLPGLWPEGRSQIRGASSLWISAAATADLNKKRRTDLTFFLDRPLGTDPTHVLFRRVMTVQQPIDAQKNQWEIEGDSGPVTVSLNGSDVAVEAFPVRHWLGLAEVSRAASCSLVLSMLPDIPAALSGSTGSASLIRTFFGYRITSVDVPQKSTKGS